jgi:hypothetical protein
MFFLSCGALSRPFSLVFVKTLPKEERPSRKRKKEEYNKKRRERSGEIVKGMSSIYRKILRYYSTVHLQFYPYYYTYPYTYPYYYTYPYTYPYYYTYSYTYPYYYTYSISPTITISPIHYYYLQLPFTTTLFNNYHYLIITLHNTINSLKKLIE